MTSTPDGPASSPEPTYVRAGLIKRDPATGLRNGHGLATARQAEQERCGLFGNKAALILIDVRPSAPALVRPATAPPRRPRAGPAQSTDTCDANDLVLRTTWTRVAEILTAACHGCDVVARLDAARFVVLAVESDLRAATALGHLLRRELWTAGLHASIGIAARRVGETMEDTLQRAALDPVLHTHPRRPNRRLSIPAALQAMVSPRHAPDLPR